MVSAQAVFGILSAGFALGGFVPYVVSILKGKTKPERSSWWIWSLLMVVALAAQYAQGARWSLALTVAFLFSNLVIAVLSLHHGYGRFAARDWLALAATVGGVGLWAATKNPLAALLITIAVDFLGNWLVMIKSWRAPYTENLLTWWLVTAGSGCALLAVGSLSSQAAIFPAYLLLANGATASLIGDRRRWRAKRIKGGLQKRRSRIERRGS